MVLVAVSLSLLQELMAGDELSLPDKGVAKKKRREHSIAISEVEEALKIDHKERKLKFIFNFDDNNTRAKRPPNHKQHQQQEATKVVRKKRARESVDEPAPVRTIQKQPKIMDGMRTPREPVGLAQKQPKMMSDPVGVAQKPSMRTPSKKVGVVSSPPANKPSDTPVPSEQPLSAFPTAEQSPTMNLLPYQPPMSPSLPLVPLLPFSSPPIIPTHCLPPYMFPSPYPLSPTQQTAVLTMDQNPYFPPLVPVKFDVTPLPVPYSYPPGFLPVDARQLSQQVSPPHPLPLHSSLKFSDSVTIKPPPPQPQKTSRGDLCPPSYQEPAKTVASEITAGDCGSEVSAPSAILTPPTSGSEELTDTEGVESKSGPGGKDVCGVCAICDSEGEDMLACQGHCLNVFHLDCLGLVLRPQFKFVCDECLLDTGKCFVCDKSQGEVAKCSKAKCPKLYHLSCIQDNKLFTFAERSKKFTCPLHVCGRCSSIGVTDAPTSGLLQCTKCPLALHKPDCLIAGCEVLSSSHMVCYQHLKVFSKHQRHYSHVNLNTCMDCGKIGSLYCCDVCSAAYHLDCLDPEDRPREGVDTWKCPSCAVHDLPTYGSMVLCKFGMWRSVESIALADHLALHTSAPG